MWEALREWPVCVLRPWESKIREANGRHLREKLTLCTDHSSVDSRIRNSAYVCGEQTSSMKAPAMWVCILSFLWL